MLFWLTELSDGGDVFNLFRYITFRAGGAFFTALIFGFIFGPPLIDLLRVRQKKGQPIRADGPQSHNSKAGTPTMGGLLVLSALLVATLLFVALLFCLRRRAFTEAFRTKRSAGVEYSDYDERVKERRAAQRERQRARGGKRRSGFGAAANGSRPAPSEYAAHEHL